MNHALAAAPAVPVKGKYILSITSPTGYKARTTGTCTPEQYGAAIAALEGLWTPTVRERPILFTMEMVQAILDGKKFQTRRLIKPKNPPDGHWMVESVGGQHQLTHWDNDTAETSPIACPYGRPGERLWVKETWQHLNNQNGERAELLPNQNSASCFYRADESNPAALPMSGKWRNSLFMPRWASRLSLKLTEVRAERLQDISAEDALEEGVGYQSNPRYQPRAGASDPIDAYRHLWEKINGPGSWDANPWVWVLKFTKA